MNKGQAFARARDFAAETGRTWYVVYDVIRKSYYAQSEYDPNQSESCEVLIDKVDARPCPADMTDEEQQAYRWALQQSFGSVAARYAKQLAQYILRIEDNKPKSRS